MISSRTPSPQKSRPSSRLALSEKTDKNLKLSPSKSNNLRYSNSNSPSRSRSSNSPTKKPLSSSSLLIKSQPNFKIFEDPKDYSTELYLSTIKINDENDYLNSKENLEPKRSLPISNLEIESPLKKQCNKRSPLQDLNIQEYPGFIEYTRTPRIQNSYQLDTKWSNSNMKQIPSFITPPKNDRIKYISFTDDFKNDLGIKRSNSLSDVDVSRPVKKLVFGIHKD
ncbi:APC/C-CDH1 modulator 1 [Wickerhamomyces ciferrii]|uniref:APC/C-CDH1 modulator 1 n=1 Tax=Wickerhamomyces ciferrii (strain ATCC 14091 / BCRC 22168 / CBS 111 / JCM 3599 / NBRC 0793 / NRRL Y-1031 F-60-10) TaxID=1206466 RepID=K0KLP6_WICCF|nr:APC/C-CDH1 modulator 1 [Wickerhamomyces ciferrii]CCH42048.1 APC/C-CDH1 modulator 1 [Wickerhamomyces ciferrii]